MPLSHRNRFFRLLSAFILLACLSFLFSCKKDDFDTSPNAKPEFSTDTIIFDTVFTSVGSATEVMTVYNRNNKPLKISSIRLANGSASDYRLNVNGVPGREFSNVEIEANDSIFIFAEVTVDPNNLNTPLIVTDSIIFVTNGNVQDVDLVAWGQDAYFHRPAANSGSPFFLLDCNEVWNNDKPHVVYGYALIDSACTLTINQGTNVHFHPGSGLIVLTEGKLIVDGTQQNPVTLQGDRLGEAYKDIPGQWDRIWFSNLSARSNTVSAGSRNSIIRYAIIKNGNIGVQADTVFSPGSTTVTLENTIVKNMVSNAILFRGSNVKAYNCVFANCGNQLATMLYGGDYSFYHCTFANFWSSSRRNPSLGLNNYYLSAPRRLDAYFGNCIVYGNNESEFTVDSFPVANQFNFLFENAIIKVESDFPTSTPFHYLNVLRAVNSSNNPTFRDPANNNYELDSLNSPALDFGTMNVVNVNPALLGTDLKGVTRPQRTAPDLGAYERE